LIMSTMTSDCHRRSDFLMVSTLGAGFAMKISSLDVYAPYISRIIRPASSNAVQRLSGPGAKTLATHAQF
jgi:hypothetical protein